MATIDPSKIKDCPVKDFQSKIWVYPNPATNTVTLDVGENPTYAYKINIYNSKGGKVMESDTRSSSKILNISTLIGGWYMVEFREGAKYYTLKFLKL